MEAHNNGFLGVLEGSLTNLSFNLFNYEAAPSYTSYLPKNLFQERKSLVRKTTEIHKIP